MEAGTNPVQKIPLMATGDDAEVFIILILDDNGGGGGGIDDNKLTEVTYVKRGTIERISNRMETHQLYYTNSLLIHLREDNMAIRNEMARCHQREKRMWKMMTKNLKSLTSRPALMHGICVPTQRREGSKGSDGSDRNRREMTIPKTV